MASIDEKTVREAKKYKDFGLGKCTYYSLAALQEKNLARIDKLPFTIRVLLENVLRNFDEALIGLDDVEHILHWPKQIGEIDIAYMPTRVVLQDFTGVPLIVDLAAMRDAMKAHGADPSKVNPLVATDLVVDHSVQVDYYGSAESLALNVSKEYERNVERYKLIKWAQKSYKNFRVVPPASGIVHQVNLEYLAPLVGLNDFRGEKTAAPDTVVGTDSHTTMINGLGVLGWGVGGIEAEAVMLGQPYYFLLPEVVGVKLTGKLPDGATATDLVLTVTELLRRTGVVDKFVEYFGPGLNSLSVPDRATLANMCPEYGATCGFFPVDEITISYLRLTGRNPKHAEFVEKYLKAQCMFREKNSPDPEFTRVIHLDMSTVKPSVSGPANPEEIVDLPGLKDRLQSALSEHYKVRKPLTSIANTGGRSTDPSSSSKVGVQLRLADKGVQLKDGDLVIAAITSCTNTSNPNVMIGSGLIAKKAVELGLTVPPTVKTSLAPGSKAVTEYLKKLGLLPYLETLGFNIVAYGCTTCIGNSGPLRPEIESAIRDNDLYVTSVLSGNRNFGGRIHQQVRGNFLASPMLVVAYALVGTMDVDITKEPLGLSKDGKQVFLKDIWPSQQEITQTVEKGMKPDVFKTAYQKILKGDDEWQKLQTSASLLYDWDPKSTYIRQPPFFKDFSLEKRVVEDIKGARILLLLGDKVSTDHISPAGGIATTSPAGQYLQENGVKPDDFNSYGSRRGNHEIMIRGTFGNVRLKNLLVPGKEGWYTKYLPTGEVMTIFDASVKYLHSEPSSPVLVLGGAQYGQGSSRDWAAKGPYLLGIKAVLAKDFERIHRSNLIGMGVLPLQFETGWKELGLDGTETFDILGLNAGLTPKKPLRVVAIKDGKRMEFVVILRLDSTIEIEYYRSGGILPFVLGKVLRAN